MTSSIVKNRVYLLLVLIVLVAGILRFYKIDQIPVSLYWDEVSLAYNAYSILETGKDEFGKNFPLLFEAFNDYKTPAYIYLTTVPVKIFGLNEFSARFASAFFGTLTVLITFFLVREIIKKKIYDIEVDHFALLTSFLVAISPWHIQLSRAGFEANTGLFFVVLGAYLIFKYVNNKKYLLLLLSLTSYAASIYFYRSNWIFTPLFLLAIFLIYFKHFFSKENLVKTSLAVLIFIFLISPFISKMISSQGLVRAGQVSVFNNFQSEVYESAKKIENAGTIGKLIYNRRIIYAEKISKNYFSHFGPSFLFLNGDGNVRHGVTGTGVLYAWAILFIIPGLLTFRKIEKNKALVLMAWLFIAPIPAALSVPSPHALRSLNLIPVPQVVLALGMLMIYSILSKKIRVVYSAFIIGLILYFFLNYLSLYMKNYANASSASWGDGYKQLAVYVFENENKYDKVVISGHYWQPYIYFLFYKKYDPNKYQLEGSKSGFDKYIFGGTSWDMQGKELGDQDLEKIAGTSNYLVALSPSEYELQRNNLVFVNQIKNHNNELVFIIAKHKK